MFDDFDTSIQIDEQASFYEVMYEEEAKQRISTSV